MAERDDIEAVSHRYRQLPREEPSSALDAAIVAQARRAAADRPAPLVAPAGRRGWAYPLAAAAVIVLAVGVTVQLQRGEPDSELSVASAPSVQGYAAKEEAAPSQPARRADAPAKKPKVAAESSNQAQAAREAAAPAPSVRDEARALAGSAAVRAESPEQWLERIAKLRDQGRDDEADRQLAEFRRRYPDYRIAPDTLRKVERRAR